MSEPDDIVAVVREAVSGPSPLAGPLAGRRVLVTAGATHEPIDPVRYLGNRSSGKMGVAIATEALRRGAQVTLVLGPARVTPPAGVDVIHVETAEEMGADMIVLGSHGYKRWERLLLGSVSNSVVHHAHCSVMVVRSPAE